MTLVKSSSNSLRQAPQSLASRYRQYSAFNCLMASISSRAATSSILGSVAKRRSVAVAACRCGRSICGVIAAHELDRNPTHGAEKQVDPRHVTEQHGDVACHGPGLLLHAVVVVGEKRQRGESFGCDV